MKKLECLRQWWYYYYKYHTIILSRTYQKHHAKWCTISWIKIYLQYNENIDFLSNSRHWWKIEGNPSCTFCLNRCILRSEVFMFEESGYRGLFGDKERIFEICKNNRWDRDSLNYSYVLIVSVIEKLCIILSCLFLHKAYKLKVESDV